jgi:hypothetical protein
MTATALTVSARTWASESLAAFITRRRESPTGVQCLEN